MGYSPISVRYWRGGEKQRVVNLPGVTLPGGGILLGYGVKLRGSELVCLGSYSCKMGQGGYKVDWQQNAPERKLRGDVTAAASPGGSLRL